MYILINKPSGPTSHDIIDQLRRITGVKKIGHAGTLDPFASGLLLVAISRESTRNIYNFIKLDKEYIATLKLGAISNSQDRTGVIEEIKNSASPTEQEIKDVLSKFVGKQEQIPPMFSAKKVKGKKLYNLARKGIEIERKPSNIEIYDIQLLEFKDSELKIKVKCSSGTYVRTLAHDIGQDLGCGAYLEELERTKIGKYDLKNSVKVEELTKENWNKFTFNS
ncbi:MAG: tRNA pseudouridine(55) synthase TruB [Patescibacteria group bacterium]